MWGLLTELGLGLVALRIWKVVCGSERVKSKLVNSNHFSSNGPAADMAGVQEANTPSYSEKILIFHEKINDFELVNVKFEMASPLFAYSESALKEALRKIF